MLAALAFAAVLAQAPAAAPPPPSLPSLTADQWRDTAHQDIEAIHDALRDNAPFTVVDRDSAGMRRWLEAGRTEALQALPSVTDGRSYFYVLRRYVGGFRDGHIGIALKPGAIPGVTPAWPGFAIAWRNGRYEVGWARDEAGASVPPVGAVVVSCDGLSAEGMATARLDRLMADLSQDGQRAASAFQLLRGYGYPQPLPHACRFRTAEGERTWRLTWSTPPGATVETAARQIMPARAQFGVDRWGDNAWWIGAPAMTGEAEWKALSAQVQDKLSAVRTADVVVIDLRGNGGGDSSYGQALAEQLWGAGMVKAHDYSWGALTLKAAPVSRQWAHDGAARAKDDPETFAYMQTLASKLDAAPTGAKVVIPQSGAEPKPGRAPSNPMHAKVVILVDGGCFSACLDTLDLFTRFPAVRLAGTSTGGDTIFMEGASTSLPSGRATLRFGVKAWAQRRRGSNVVYQPEAGLRFTGDQADDAGLKRWLARKLAVGAAG